MKLFYFLIILLAFKINAQSNIPTINELEEDVEPLISYQETLPIFPGCENVSEDFKINCLKEKIKNFILQNSTKKYKKYLKKNSLSLNLTHQKDGTITLNNHSTTPYYIETKDIVKKLPKIIPATQRNKPVKFTFEIIINE